MENEQKPICTFCNKRLKKRTIKLASIFYTNPNWLDYHNSCYKKKKTLERAREIVRQFNPDASEEDIDNFIRNW